MPLILLEGGDFFGIGRPQHHGPLTVPPTSVVGGIPKIFDAVGGELGFLLARHVFDPQIPVFDKNCFFSVW